LIDNGTAPDLVRVQTQRLQLSQAGDAIGDAGQLVARENQVLQLGPRIKASLSKKVSFVTALKFRERFYMAGI
jgi:hypothetical protein